MKLNIPQLTCAQLKQKYSQFWETENTYFSGGETQAIATLNSFLSSRYHGYHWKISRPWLTQQGAKSHLSPHLTFGTISIRQVYQSTKAKSAELASNPKAQFSLKAFRDRLRWHDSFTQRLYFHPELVEELRGYNLSEILNGAYLNESLYPEPILDWAQTRKTNGKIVSNLRKRVKERLVAEQGIELEQAAIAKKILDKYWENKDKQY